MLDLCLHNIDISYFLIKNNASCKATLSTKKISDHIIQLASFLAHTPCLHNVDISYFWIRKNASCKATLLTKKNL